MQGQPIPFIELKEQGQETIFEIHPAAIKLLQSIAGKKVAILTIAGPQRTGKSFLANRILKRQKGFAIGPTTQPCTKGIWLWSQPIQITEDSVLLIMDTEGLNSVQRDIGIDIKIFSISLLLSSMFVYNQLGHIDEQSIENLSLVIKLSENISAGNEDSINQFFPSFLWVLRDFSLDLKGRTSREYLENALNVQGDEKKNQIRSKIREFFTDRDCITMVRPLNEEYKLARIEDQDWNSLRAEFIESVRDFESKVSKIKVKAVKGIQLTAEMFLKLSLEYVDAINSGGIPEILTSLDRVVQQCARQILEDLKTQYNKRMAQMKSPIEEEELNNTHRQICVQILEQLEKRSFELMDQSKTLSMKAELQEIFDQDLTYKLEINREQSTAISNQLLGKFFNSFQVPIMESVSPSLLTDKFAEYTRFFKYYVENARGQSKYKSIAEKVPSFLFGFFEKILQQVQKIYQEENNVVKKYLIEARQGEERLKKTISNYESLLYEVQKEKDSAVYDADNCRRELQKVLKLKQLEIDTLTQQVQQQIIDAQAKKDKNVKIKNEVKLLQEQLQRARNELNAKRVETAQLLKRQSDEIVPEDISDVVLQYKDMKYHAQSMNEFFRRRAMDNSQQGIFINEIQKLQQDKFMEVQKMRDDFKLKKQKFRDELAKEKQSLKDSLQLILKQNEELKAHNITLYERLENSTKGLQQLKSLQQVNQRQQISLEEKQNTLDMHIQVIDNFTKDIEKLTGVREDLEQKLAFMNSEKSNLISFKESFPYILKESLKWVVFKKSQIKHAIKQVGDDEQRIIRDCFREVGIDNI